MPEAEAQPSARPSAAAFRENEGQSVGQTQSGDQVRSDEQKPGQQTETAPGVRLRHVLAITVIAIGCLLALLSLWIPALESCKDVSGTVNNQLSTVPTCAPWGVSELVPFALLALTCIFPDLTEIGVTNLFTLKRQVDAQKAEVDASKERQDALEARVMAQVQTVSSSQTQTIIIDSAQAAKVPGAVLDKGRNLLGVLPTPEPADTTAMNDAQQPSEADSPSEPLLITELLGLWEKMRPFAFYSGYGNRTTAEPLNEEQLESLRRWRGIFSSEIDFVRAARNTVAHAQPIEYDTLRAATQSARELVGYLRELGLTT